ncbi:MAG: hypothetical protein KGO96_09655 [Elusimicrobia bacterium]|nr:hypothetical protein [Elusimicrobiota bacterium]MDE2237760.1 hypothetical protein [Elusimicrobiota bacterium]MDE2426154.1 hypothetical protein [Elusimicrobiota bacterium]
MRKGCWLTLLVVAALAGCADAPLDSGRRSDDVDRTVSAVEAGARESRTLASLAKIEESLAAYIGSEKRIPETLDVLVPQYLAAIPPVELGVRGHRDTNRVELYPQSLLRDGQIDGSRLKDTGRWGYVHNDHQVVVFIDCTHRSPSGTPWYLRH